MAHSYQASVSNDCSFSSGAVSGHTGTSRSISLSQASHRDRAPARYSRSCSYPHHSYAKYRRRPCDFGGNLDATYNSVPGPSIPTMEDMDMYDDRSLDDAPVANTQALEDRISLPVDRSRGTRSDGQSSKDAVDGTTSVEERDPLTGLVGKDPEKLRQKVLESLAEKKKKAAVFMHEGVMKKEGSVDAVSAGTSADSGHENPEREAAVEALLATFGSKDKKPDPPRGNRREGPPEQMDAEARHKDNHNRKASLDRKGHHSSDDIRTTPLHIDRYTSKSDYASRRDEFSRLRTDDDRPHRSSEYSARLEPRDYREIEEHDNSPRTGHHYRDERARFEDYPSAKGEVKIKGRAPANTSSERYPAPPSAGDVRSGYRAPPRDDYYKGPDTHREPPPKDAFETPRPHRYPPPDLDYPPMPARDYAYLPAPPGRYLPPVDDPRYPSASARGPEPDYATMYYRDLSEWLEITGYHDYSYRTLQLERHRALEASRHYAIAHDDPTYLTRPPPPREEPDSRHGRGAPSYAMPPPPSAGWEERDVPPRPISRGYPPSMAQKDRYAEASADKSSLKRRISSRDDDIRDPPSHSTKSARHAYDDPYRRAGSPGKDDGATLRRSESGNYGNDSLEEKDSVRRTLAERIGRRDPSPPEDDRRRSLSPRGYDSGYQGTRRYDGEYRGRGRGRGYGRGGYNNEWDRGGSNGDEFSNRSRGYGRGKGRGRGSYNKDHRSPERTRYDIRDGPNYDHLAEARNNPVRYFMIKSYNEDNVKIAQEECVWATQQKNTEVLQEAFEKSNEVILFFSINKSGKFQGYARMEGPPGSAPVPSWSRNLLWESSGPFRIRWLSITDISFHRVAHLKNRYNEMQPVLIGRDGQEIDPYCGEQLCKSMDEAAHYRQQQTNDH